MLPIQKTLIDIVGYDQNFYFYNVPILKKDSYVFYKLFFYTYDLYINHFFSNLTSLHQFHKIALWYERELREMFNCLVENQVDVRNLLLDYSSKTPVMLKTTPLESYVEIKKKQTHFFALSTTIEL